MPQTGDHGSNLFVDLNAQNAELRYEILLRMCESRQKAACIRTLADREGSSQLILTAEESQLHTVARLATEDAVLKLTRRNDWLTVEAQEHVSSPEPGLVGWAFWFDIREDDSMAAFKGKTLGHDGRNVLNGDAELPALYFAILTHLQVDIPYGVRGNRKSQALIPSGLRQD